MEDILFEKAKRQFGELRAEELRPEIEKTAFELTALQKYPITIEDAP